MGELEEFSVTHIGGSMEQPDDFSGFSALLDELDDAIAPIVNTVASAARSS